MDLSIYIHPSINISASSPETESHLPFNARKLFESENRLPRFLVTSLRDRHGKWDRKWYGDDVCVFLWGRGFGSFPVLPPPLTCLWVKDHLLRLNFHSFIQLAMLQMWPHICFHLGFIPLQHSAKRTGWLPFDLLRTHCESGCIWRIVCGHFYCRGNGTATVSLLFPVKGRARWSSAVLRWVEFPGLVSADLAVNQVICLH